jgi:hypothetical protein
MSNTLARHKTGMEGTTRTIPGIVPWLVVGIVLLGFVAVLLTVRSHGSSNVGSGAALTSCPQTPTPATTGATGAPVQTGDVGAPAIKPDKSAPAASLCPGSSIPSYSAAEAAAFTAKYNPFGLRPVVSGSKLTVISATFMSAAAANKMLGTSLWPPNELVCVVLGRGRFEGVGGGAPGMKTTIYDAVYVIYGGHTGNLLMTVGTDSEK